MGLSWILTGDDNETWAEEIFNRYGILIFLCIRTNPPLYHFSSTHIIGLIGALIGVYLLCFNIIFKEKRDYYKVISVLGYGLALISIFVISSAYHISGLFANKSLKEKLRPLDHCVIYFVIAGTYTPIVTIGIIKKGASFYMGCCILFVEWVGAILGIALKIIYQINDLNTFVSTAHYLILGWAILPVIKPIIRIFPTKVIFLTFLGGILYSSGIWFFLWDSLQFNHGIWHIFVVAAASLHFLSVAMIVNDLRDFRSLKILAYKTLNDIKPNFFKKNPSEIEKCNN